MNENKSNYKKFLEIYNELDEHMRKVLAEGFRTSHSTLINEMADINKIFYKYKEFLLEMAKLRNLIVHNSDSKNAEPIAEPHIYIVKKYENILNQLKNPSKVIETVAIKSEYIYTTSMEDIAIDVMKEMNKKTYTHVPVVENGSLIGVFSENTIFSYMAAIGDVLIERDTKIEEFAEFIPIDKHVSEYFKFAPKDALVIDIEEIFKEELQNKKRLSVVFITETGKPTEKILGLITAWDIAGYEEKIIKIEAN